MALGCLIFNGVFDKYPGLKVGFMEAGTAWFLLALERFGGSYETNTPHDPRGYFFEQGEHESVCEPATEMCKHEIEELRGNPGLTEADKANILAANAERFYRIRVPVAS